MGTTSDGAYVFRRRYADGIYKLIVHCSMLAEDAIKSAISNYYTKNPKARQTDLGGTNAPLPKVEVETISQNATSI